MPIWARSIFRAFVLVLLAAVAVAWASQRETGLWGWGLILTALGSWLIFRLRRFLRSRRQRQEQRWEAAIYERGLRAQALRELRAQVGRAPKKPGKRLNIFVARSLSLAELLDADERYDEAVAVARAIPVELLSNLDAGLVRHTQAVIHLRAGDHKGAERILGERHSSGDLELDQRLTLLEAYVMAESGEPAEAMEKVQAIEGDRSADPSVTTEARVVMAAALDVQGQCEEALVVLATVGRAALEPLSHLGLPRVRGMARELLQGTRTPPDGPSNARAAPTLQ